MGRILAYARVSTKEQHLSRQIDKLSEYVSKENIIVDKASGKDIAGRPGYQALKGALGLRPGDVLYITSLDRLSRNKEQIKTELQWFKDNKVSLRILDLPTSLVEVPTGQEWIVEMISNILIEVLSSIAEQERLVIHERQAAGIASAKARGKYLGRPKLEIPDNFDEVYQLWKIDKKITAKEAAIKIGVPRSSFYKIVHKYEESVYKGL